MTSLSRYLIILFFLACEHPISLPPETGAPPYFEQATDYFARGVTDSAFLTYNDAKDFFLKRNDSLSTSYALSSMAIILSGSGDYYGSQELLLNALGYLDEDNPNHRLYLGATYNSLGRATYRLNDFENALKFYHAAIQFSDDSATTTVFRNNIARTYQEMGDYESAINVYSELLVQVPPAGLEYARVLTNRAVARAKYDPNYDALGDLIRALHIRQKARDDMGTNASFAHLSDYYARIQHPLALSYALQRYQLARKLQIGEEEIEALGRLINLSPPDAAKAYFPRFKALSDSLQLSRSNARNQFAIIRYQVEKNEADNLRLQKENVEQAHRVTRHRVWMGSIIALGIFLGVLGFLGYRKRTERIALEAQNRVKAHQLKTSRKIHDVVANGLYRVMAEIENREDIDRNQVLDSLENMYERSRIISYDEEDQPVQREQPYHDQVSDILRAFATDAVRIFIVGNEPKTWEGVSATARNDTSHVVQEMMVNMRKHSGANQVTMRFERTKDELVIQYTDNGKGLPEEFRKGNGMRNTENRIEGLNGYLKFASKPGKGLKITISLPIP